MQLFGLVNTLLSVDTDSFKRRLHIQRYAVIPLAPNAGLLSWVKDSDTLHVLIKDYRESRKVLLNVEYRLMLQVCFLLTLFYEEVALMGRNMGCRWHPTMRISLSSKKSKYSNMHLLTRWA